MKNLFIALLALIICSTSVRAQQETTRTSPDRRTDPAEMDVEQYENMMDERYRVEFRKTAIERMGLERDEIERFDPLFDAYRMEKEQLAQKRRALFAEYKDEMAEDDSVEDETNETADFIENYWEIDIDEMELKKDYFDRLEDVIGPDRALQFLAMEEAFQSEVKRMRMLRQRPDLIILEPEMGTYDKRMNKRMRKSRQ